MPSVGVRQSYRGPEVVETLERVTRLYGKPRMIRVGNGPEFISRALALRAYISGAGQSHFKLPLPILAASTLHRDCKGVVSA